MAKQQVRKLKGRGDYTYSEPNPQRSNHISWGVEVPEPVLTNKQEYIISSNVVMSQSQGVTSPGSFKVLNPQFDTAGYIPEKRYFRDMYMVNPVAKRPVDAQATAILSNGYEIITQNPMDAEKVKNFITYSNFEGLLHSALKDDACMGDALWQVFANTDKETSELCPIMVAPIMTESFRPIQNEQNEIIWDKNKLKGFEVLDKNGQVAATFPLKKVVYFATSTPAGSPVGVSNLLTVISNIQQLEKVKNNTITLIDRALPTRQIIRTGASPEELQATYNQVTSNAFLPAISVTSELVEEKVHVASTAQFDISKYLDQLRAEVAAAYSMPIEMLLNTATLKSPTNDFNQRYQGWMQYIRILQRIIALTLKVQLFDRWICSEPVEVRFNDPAFLDIPSLMKNMGYLSQNKYSKSQIYQIIQGDWSSLKHDRSIILNSDESLLYDDTVERTGEYLLRSANKIPYLPESVGGQPHYTNPRNSTTNTGTRNTRTETGNTKSIPRIQDRQTTNPSSESARAV